MEANLFPSGTPGNKVSLFPDLLKTVQELVTQFDTVPIERKNQLKRLAAFVEGKLERKEKAELNFICTHNSRRSHLAQIWAQTAAACYGIDGVICYSGGTEATAFNPRAVKAMEEAGFIISKTTGESNPVYAVKYAADAPGLSVYSKKYDADGNPTLGFGAVMTCSHADHNCPIVLGAEARFSILYEDPKDFDGTHREAAAYRERVLQIGLEMLYTFSTIRTNS